MRDRAVQGNNRRKPLLLGSPHPSRLRRATFPQGGKALVRCNCRDSNNHRGSALQARKQGNSDPLASVSRTIYQYQRDRFPIIGQKESLEPWF